MKTYKELVTAFTEYPYSNITVGQFKKIIEYYPSEKIPFSIKEYDSWRGIYAHPYIKPSAAYSSKQQLLDSINKILTGCFEGWKGGHYRYDITRY